MVWKPKALVGPYELEDRIASGGMAEVYVAKRVGPHGFAKLVALKRILPQYASDPDFVAMFVDEARLAAHLDHPNIVQVFDFGEAAGELFLAMELIHGSTVNRILRVAQSRAEPIPLDVALHIASETARALAYAHTMTDQQGKSLGIVHRDVSPANVLVTRTGHVKLGDFGIARAAGTMHRTDDGRLRGKLGYMSPEQVTGGALDGRSDVFTLATMLSEMLIGEPLFGAGADLEVLLRIRDVDVRALDRGGRRIPRDVRGIVEYGLARDRAHRPTAAQFADSLDEAIRRRGGILQGPALLARLLTRYDLVPKSSDRIRLEPGARPTRAIPEVEETNETERLVRNLSTTNSPAIYRVKLPSGDVIGPIGYSKIVELISTGVVDKRSRVSKEDGLWLDPITHTEIARFITSPAFDWAAEPAQPTWRGEIRASMMLALAHRFAVDRETGVVHLNDGVRRKKVYFVEGKPEFVTSTTRQEMLGEYLVQSGICLRMEVEMALAVLPRYGGRLGDALVGIGVMRPVELYHAVAGQVRSRYLEALRWQRGHWSFERGVHAKEEAFPLAFDPLELLRDSVLESGPDELDGALSPHLDRIVLAAEAPAAPVSAFRLPDSWSRVITTVNGDRTLREIVERGARTGALAADEARRALYLGLSCELLVLSAA